MMEALNAPKRNRFADGLTERNPSILNEITSKILHIVEDDDR